MVLVGGIGWRRGKKKKASPVQDFRVCPLVITLVGNYGNILFPVHAFSKEQV